MHREDTYIMKFFNHIFNKHRYIAVSILAILAFVVILKVFAATPYAPGASLDPATGPGDSFVTIPTGLGTENVPNSNVSVGSITGPVSTGTNHTFLGIGAGGSNDIASYNTFLGDFAGGNNEAAGSPAPITSFPAIDPSAANTFIGSSSGINNIIGSGNTFLGMYTGANNNADSNTFIGAIAGFSNTTGGVNIAIGKEALYSNTTANNNIAIGGNALKNNISGSNNISIGSSAGLNSVGSGNIFLGFRVGRTFGTGDEELWIDNTDTATPLIFGDFAADALTVNGDLTITGTCIGCGSTTIIPYSAVIDPGVVRYIAWQSATSEEAGNPAINSGANFVSPRSGTIKRLSLFVSSNDTTSNSVFTIRVSPNGGAFAPSAVTIIVPAGNTGPFSSANDVSISEFDRISLEVASGGGGGVGILFNGGLEIE